MSTLATMIDAGALQQYLYDHIPLSRAMAIGVAHATFEHITLTAPLAPNINHRDTVFGGSASAVAILSAWALLYVKLKQEGLNARVVIQRNSMAYERPIVGNFSASASIDDAAVWQRFREMLSRKKRARINVTSVLWCNDERVGVLEGDFVALLLT